MYEQELDKRQRREKGMGYYGSVEAAKEWGEVFGLLG